MGSTKPRITTKGAWRTFDRFHDRMRVVPLQLVGTMTLDDAVALMTAVWLSWTKDRALQYYHLHGEFLGNI
jgi:hypothetical protein